MESMEVEIKTEERDMAGLEPGEVRQGALREKPCVKEEPAEGPSMNWDSQLQDFLRTLQAPQFSGETAPLLGPRPCGGPETREATTQTTTEAMKWPKGLWVSSDLVSFLEEAKQDPETQLDATHEGKEKEDPLAGDPLWSEMQRQRFRSLGYRGANGPRELCRQLQEGCRQWLKPERRTKEQILELVTLEQFLAILPLEMQSWVRKEGPKSCAQAVMLAEDFLLRQQKAKGGEQQITGVLKEASVDLPASDQAVPDTVETHLSLEAVPEVAESRNVFGNGRVGQRRQWKAQFDSPKKAEPLETSSQKAKVPAILEEEKEVIYDERKENLGPSSPPMTPENGQMEKTYKCWNCGQSFGSSSDLLTHERTHVGERMYKCAHCGETERFHKGQVSCVCSRCGNNIRGPFEGKGEKSCKSLDCGKDYPGKEFLQHQRTHQVVRKYECYACGKQFCQKLDFLIHQRTHKSERRLSLGCFTDQKPQEAKEPYPCLVCEEVFGTKKELSVHQRTHATGMLNKCSYCGKCYRYKLSLRSHELIHTPVWSCCGENFNQLSEFLLHESTHARK